MAKEKKANGGTNGDAGAPAEAHAPEVQQEAMPSAEPAAEAPTSAPQDIPPDAQTAPAEPVDELKAMGLDELKVERARAQAIVREAEAHLAKLVYRERSVEHELCERYQARAKEQGKKRAFVMLDGKRMAVKKRNNSELLQLVSAEIDDAIQA